MAIATVSGSPILLRFLWVTRWPQSLHLRWASSRRPSVKSSITSWSTSSAETFY